MIIYTYRKFKQENINSETSVDAVFIAAPFLPSFGLGSGSTGIVGSFIFNIFFI